MKYLILAALVLLAGSVGGSAQELFPIQQSKVTGGLPTITINGLSSGITVNAGASMAVAVANGPGNQWDYMDICNVGTVSNATCDGLGYQWNYLTCSHTPASAPPYLKSASCPMAAPSIAGNYQAVFLGCSPSSCPNSGYSNVLASVLFTVTGGGGMGTACNQPDSGMGPSLGLNCNTQVSDDFNGTSVDTTKWHVPSCGSYTEGNGYLHQNASAGVACGSIWTLNQDNLRRPMFVEYRVRYYSADGSCIFCNGNQGYRLQEWSCGSDSNNTGNCVVGGSGVVNVPEVDYNETFAAQLRAGSCLWNGGGQGCNLIQPTGAQTLSDNTNWHIVQMLESPNGAATGTTTWWVDGVEQGSVTNPGIQDLHPEQSSDGTGMTFIIGGGCSPAQGACPQGAFHDIDYFHVYQ